MSSLFIGLIPGVVALGAVLLIVRGIYLAASDPSEVLDLDEVALLKKAERDRHAGPLESLAMRFLPVVRGALLPAPSRGSKSRSTLPVAPTA